MGGVREGVLEGTGERARERARECWRAQETCAVRQPAGEWRRKQTSISCSRSQGICLMHAPQSCGSVCHRSTASEGRPSSGVRGCALVRLVRRRAYTSWGLCVSHGMVCGHTYAKNEERSGSATAAACGCGRPTDLGPSIVRYVREGLCLQLRILRVWLSDRRPPAYPPSLQ